MYGPNVSGGGGGATLPCCCTCARICTNDAAGASSKTLQTCVFIISCMVLSLISYIISTFISLCVCMYVYVYIYIYIYAYVYT